MRIDCINTMDAIARQTKAVSDYQKTLLSRVPVSWTCPYELGKLFAKETGLRKPHDPTWRKLERLGLVEMSYIDEDGNKPVGMIAMFQPGLKLKVRRIFPTVAQ